MKTIFAFLPAHKLLIILSCLFISVSIQAQNADERVSKMMNEARWFDLEQELNTAPVDSLTPFLRQMAASMTHHYFNRPDSACIELKNLLENHQQDLGGNTMNMVILLGMNMARTENYTEAAGLRRTFATNLQFWAWTAHRLLLIVNRHNNIVRWPHAVPYANRCTKPVSTVSQC